MIGILKKRFQFPKEIHTFQEEREAKLEANLEANLEDVLEDVLEQKVLTQEWKEISMNVMPY